VCDRVVATDEDHERIAPGEGEHLCWRAWSPSQCESARVDWRARHEALRRDVAAALGLHARTGHAGLVRGARLTRRWLDRARADNAAMRAAIFACDARHEALTRACRALAGLDSSGLDVSHEAQRAVLRAHGWTHSHDLPWWGDRAVTSHEEWTHASLAPVRVCVLPDAEDARDEVRRWSRDVAAALGRASQAEVLAEAIDWQARQ
jgi:hypothetical protein